MPYHPAPSRRSGRPIESVRDLYEARFMAIKEVKGVGIGRDSEGREAIVLYVSSESVRTRVPSSVEGYPIELVRTGEIVAL